MTTFERRKDYGILFVATGVILMLGQLHEGQTGQIGQLIVKLELPGTLIGIALVLLGAYWAGNQNFPTWKELLRNRNKAQPIQPKIDLDIPIKRRPNPTATQFVPSLLPSITIFKRSDRRKEPESLIKERGAIIVETLALLGIKVAFVGSRQGPTITQYLIQPAITEKLIRGEITRVRSKVGDITKYRDDLALALSAKSLRIQAPIPGTPNIGIELMNQATSIVRIRDLITDPATGKAELPLLIGESLNGYLIVDLARLPHLLVAGTTGSGKSSFIHSVVSGLIALKTPDIVKFIMIDPKMVEMVAYKSLPHLYKPVITEAAEAKTTLEDLAAEMDNRYRAMSQAGAKEISQYNQKSKQKMPYIVAIIDEMADLMAVAQGEVEQAICRLAQKGRAAGIHLIIATQRPTVNVVTGTIKANFPARLAFAVVSGTDSKVILDALGAEELIGKGDLLFLSQDSNTAVRGQGVWIDNDEIERLVKFWKTKKAL